MYSKCLLLFFEVCFVLDYTSGQRDKKFFRKGYAYLEASESFYKIHTIHNTWSEAKKTCKLEGAQLFYPDDENEANVVLSFWNSTQPFGHVFIGISDLVAEGVYETVDGLPMSDVYNKWAPGEPNNAGGSEDCVVMNKQTGTLNDEPCSKKVPFICKKSLQSLEWNEPCNMPLLDYFYHGSLGRCYKFHLAPLNWIDAHIVCKAEQSYLAVINSQLEADYLVYLAKIANLKQVPGDYLRGAVLLGFHNRINEDWQTVKGLSLRESGYDTWGTNQPDGGDKEMCGSMFDNGRLNDVSCSAKCLYICEHEIDTRSTLPDNWFGKITQST